MASGDIEYFIKFPNNTPKQSSPNGEDDFVHVKQEDKCPVVVLLGWIGSKEKHLARYSDIYDAQGCITVRCCVPLNILMFQHYRYPEMASKLLDLIRDMSLDEHPIFFHVFSNGGCYMYQYIINEIQRRSLKIELRGSIFDSAPGKMRSCSVYKTITASSSGLAPVRAIFAIFACFLMYVTHFGMLFLRHLVNKKYLSGDVFNNLVAAPNDTPSLFIFSEDDKFVNVKDVQDFIVERKREGAQVWEYKLKQSPHVMHLLTSRDKYIETVTKFLQFCLKDEEYVQEDHWNVFK